jgi:hypothetical protein
VVVGARRARLPIALMALCVGSRARADQEVVELRYVAPPECPSRASFEAEILERTPNVRLAAPAQRVFEVTMEATPDGFRGTLVVDRIADKELSAPRCEDLTSALALVTALAIDPTASVAPRAPPPPSEPARRSFAWSFEVDLDAMVEAGVGPGALFAAAIEARLTLRNSYAFELAAIVGRDSTEQDDATARFTWLAARPGACLRGLVERVTLDACGHVEVGAVRANGAMIINERDLTRLWLAAGLHGNARVPLGSRGFGLLQVGTSLPLVRDRYIFAPNVAVHETPGLTGWLVVGIGLRFL